MSPTSSFFRALGLSSSIDEETFIDRNDVAQVLNDVDALKQVIGDRPITLIDTAAHALGTVLR